MVIMLDSLLFVMQDFSSSIVGVVQEVRTYKAYQGFGFRV